jgi:sugar-specific transcriptional regulator TrmB
MLSQLKKLGLSRTEAKVYLAMLELGEATTTRIAQKAGQKRTTTYSAITALRDTGLITRAKRSKRFVYFIDDPTNLLTSTKEKVDIAESIIPSLISMSRLIDKKPRVTFYEGLEGLKNMQRATLYHPNTPLYGWVPTATLQGDISKWFDDEHRPKRIKNRMFFYTIAADNEYARRYQAFDEKGLKKTLIDTSGELVVGGSTQLFGTRSVMVYSWEDMVGVIVESEMLYNTFKSIFKIHWRALGGETLN